MVNVIMEMLLTIEEKDILKIVRGLIK